MTDLSYILNKSYDIKGICSFFEFYYRIVYRAIYQKLMDTGKLKRAFPGGS